MKTALFLLSLSFAASAADLNEYCRITSVNQPNNIFGDSVAVWGTPGVDDDMTDLGLAPGYLEIGELAYHSHDGHSILISGDAKNGWSASLTPKGGEFTLTLSKGADGKGAVQVNGKPLATIECD
jgi:hypothetical protein